MDFFGIIGTILIGVVVLGVLVVVHEAGHFLVAKACGVGVLEFSIGFGKKIWQKRVSGTRYGIGIVPLGGYVRMVGDDPYHRFGEEVQPESGSTPDNILQSVEDADDEDVKAMLSDKNRWFLERGFLPRFAIVLAGPAANLLFAVFLGILVSYFHGENVPLKEPVIGTVMQAEDKVYPAYEAGMLENDRILSVNGETVTKWIEFTEKIRNCDGKDIKLVVERKVDGKLQQKDILLKPMPMEKEMALVTGGNEKNYFIGVSVATKIRPLSLKKSIQNGFKIVYSLSDYTLRSLGWLITGKVGANSLGGPISIVKYAGKSAEKGKSSLISFVIFLSVSLAILNLLPIPILDGGHLMFFTIDLIMSIFGYHLSVKVQDVASRVGFAFLMSLMMFAIVNDIYKLF